MMRVLFSNFLLLYVVTALPHPLNVTSPPAPKSGATFVHLFEWSWDDVAQECEDWLGPKGDHVADEVLKSALASC